MHNAQQSRGGKKLFFNFTKILQKYENSYQAVYEISLKYDAYNHQKIAIKNPPNYNLPYWRCYLWSKKGVKESLIAQSYQIVPYSDMFHSSENSVSFLNSYVSFCRLGSF